MALLVALAAPLAASCLRGLASSQHGNMWMTSCIFSGCLQVFKMAKCCFRFRKTIILEHHGASGVCSKLSIWPWRGPWLSLWRQVWLPRVYGDLRLCRHDVLIISIQFRRCSLRYLPCDMWTKWVPDLAANVDTVMCVDPLLAFHF